MKNYIDIPQYTTLKNIQKNSFTFSATQYKTFNIKNNNKLKVKDFLYRDLIRNDLGVEVGSESYIDNSDYYFMKTAALQEDTNLIDINRESMQPIIPKKFIKMDLKKGDILISKDSNVGEVAILEKDYPNIMLCGGIYKLPIKEHKYYFLAFAKNEIFKKQIDFLVPRGSTIKHGKTKFLECYIPIPNRNKDKIMNYVELLMQAIIDKEIIIREKHKKILEEIEKELENNQLDNEFKYEQPTINNIIKHHRLDTSLYSEEFERNNFTIKNYKYGYISLTERGYKGIRGTSLENNFIKSRIDSDEYIDGFYELIIPTNISEFGYVKKSSYIGTPVKLKTIKKGDIIFGGEGFGKGRTFVVCEDVKNIATNYHGIRIVNANNDIIDSIFIRCFLAYWREKGMIDRIGVGGSGGHCAPSYFHLIVTPKFPEGIKKEIVKLYHNNIKYENNNVNENNFLEIDHKYNLSAGIYEIDKNIKTIKKHLNNVIEKIANDEEILIDFNIL